MIAYQKGFHSQEADRLGKAIIKAMVVIMLLTASAIGIGFSLCCTSQAGTQAIQAVEAVAPAKITEYLVSSDLASNPKNRGTWSVISEKIQTLLINLLEGQKATFGDLKAFLDLFNDHKIPFEVVSVCSTLIGFVEQLTPSEKAGEELDKTESGKETKKHILTIAKSIKQGIDNALKAAPKTRSLEVGK